MDEEVTTGAGAWVYKCGTCRVIGFGKKKKWLSIFNTDDLASIGTEKKGFFTG